MLRQKWRRLLLLSLVVMSLIIYVRVVAAAPTGANINSASTDTGPTSTPGNRTDARGTITTITLEAIQQDQHWKGYLGNVTGTLALRDADSNTLYDWSSLSSPSGEVYASRSSSLDFSSVACAAAGTISSEETALNMTGSEADSISNTFNSTDHASVIVNGVTLTGCPYTSMYVNSISQGQDSNDDFQEILIQDAGSNLVYTAVLNDNTVGFDGNTYDFQMIVAESAVASTPHTYYFYLELDG